MKRAFSASMHICSVFSSVTFSGERCMFLAVSPENEQGFFLTLTAFAISQETREGGRRKI